MRFSILFFSNDSLATGADLYKNFIDAVIFADREGFEAVWVPERHFHRFGGAFPNPAILSAAAAVLTTRIRLRAGSVVLPLHDTLQIAEQWAVVDHLSHGRVDIAVAAGWNPDDFALSPLSYSKRHELLIDRIGELRRLWRGDGVARSNGEDEPVTLRTFPSPWQKELNLWMTCTGGDARFRAAAETRTNVLTGLLFMGVAELECKIAEYRRIRSEQGDSLGRVTLMLHAYVGRDLADVRRAAVEPLKRYLGSSAELWGRASESKNVSARQKSMLINWGVEKYMTSQGLFGDLLACADRVDKLAAIGVDEIACLIDFGLSVADQRSCLERIRQLQFRTS